MAEKVKPIKLTDTATGDTYTLEFNREAVRFAEARGFAITEVEKFPMTIYDLFYYAFRMHHRKLNKEKIEEIYNHFTEKEALAEALATMYNSALDTLFDEPEDNEKNVKWKQNF